MRLPSSALRITLLAAGGLSFAFACAFDSSLRLYLDARFWLPFAHQLESFERKSVKRIDAPFAGMTKSNGATTNLARLRAVYQSLSQRQGDDPPPDLASLSRTRAAAQVDTTLAAREREEVSLIDAKIDMRLGEEDPSAALLQTSQGKLTAFLRSARTPEFLSEARGWAAHIDFLLGNKTAAGKFYLDELNRDGSNLSRETLLSSLRIVYGYDGGDELRDHLALYFDTPEHAAFAIQLITNPRFDDDPLERPDQGQIYQNIRALLDSHSALLSSNRGSTALALLRMRTALRLGDPPGVLAIAASVPAKAAVRDQPEFDWMLASAQYLTHRFASAEAPLLRLFHSRNASAGYKAAAAYGLCGVYAKTGNFVEQIRFALWLKHGYKQAGKDESYPSSITDQSIYWAESGWDLNLLLEDEAPDEALETFLERYPGMPDVRLVTYALAVRRARENRYRESAQLYESIHATWRAPRMRELSRLFEEASLNDPQAKFNLARFLIENDTRIYFNDQLWGRLQNYALQASEDIRLTREERQTLTGKERKLRDDQEERWRAWLILRDIVHDAPNTPIARDAARLAQRSLRGINPQRFGREDEIRAADIEMSAFLRHAPNPP